MTRQHSAPDVQVPEGEWVTFPGGELEGTRPKALCQACRVKLQKGICAKTLCFQCYRADLDRQRGLKAAGELSTASDARFQTTLPFEPVNRARLEMLRVERVAARQEMRTGVSQYVDKRRRAQIEARHALAALAAGLRARRASDQERERTMASAIHAAELQLPEAWLPFVVSR